MKENQTCGTCKFFERGQWHKETDPNESGQYGGDCKVICAELRLDNDDLRFMESMYVYESFGCSLWKSKCSK